MRENGRLAKAKASALEDLNSQIYINVFARKNRLTCFASLDAVEEDETPESTPKPPMQEMIVRKKKAGKNKKKTVLLQ